jgi:ferredoxin-NADP reductase
MFPCGAAAAAAPVTQSEGEAMTHTVEIRNIEDITHNVKQFTFTKPDGFTFEPGQATDVSIDKDGWREDKHPFTFTALPGWDDLQFTIKIYPERHGLTEQIGRLAVGDRFLIEDAWGTIQYRGKGTFIAGGAGVTPFIAILRNLQAKGEIAGHRLIFSNHTSSDIILKDEFDAMEGLDTLYVLTSENDPRFAHGRIDKAFIEEHVQDFSQNFYVCGPDGMVEDINGALKELGADPEGLVFER